MQMPARPTAGRVTIRAIAVARRLDRLGLIAPAVQVDSVYHASTRGHADTSPRPSPFWWQRQEGFLWRPFHPARCRKNCPARRGGNPPEGWCLGRPETRTRRLEPPPLSRRHGAAQKAPWQSVGGQSRPCRRR